jgi:large subunit ribosomal protein L10
VEAGLSMRVVYDEGLMVMENQLHIDVAGTLNALKANQSEAFQLAMGIAYPTAETIGPLLQFAQQQAMSLSVTAGVISKDTIGELLRKANAQMESLSSAVDKAKPKA